MNWWALAIVVLIVGAIVTSGFWCPETHPTDWECRKCNQTLMNCRCGYE